MEHMYGILIHIFTLVEAAYLLYTSFIKLQWKRIYK